MTTARKRVAGEVRGFRFRESQELGNQLFRDKKYEEFVDVVEPFSDLLDDTQRKKLDFAKSRLTRQ